MRRTPVQHAVGRCLAALRLAPGSTVVTALSGGADSVALLDALAGMAAASGIRVVAAHLDHGLREDSAADAAFCADTCLGMGVALRQGRADVRARARRDHGGIEEAARRERYAFLDRVADEEDAAVIAVAHTRDDQAETLLLRLLRGAGTTGLGAMRVRQGRVVRPLLAVGREDVLGHLAARGLAWREDPTNGDTTVMRNRVRRELLPYLETHFNPRLREALSRTAALLADEADATDEAARALLRDAHVDDVDGVVLKRAPIAAASRATARAALRLAIADAGGLRGVGLVHVDRLLALVGNPARSRARLAFPGGRQAVVGTRTLRLGLAEARA